MFITEQLLKDLSDYILLKTGIRYFSRIKKTGNNIMVSCPWHKEGQEHSPSCGVQIQNTDRSSAGTVHCFACKQTGDIAQVVKELLGEKYNENEVEARFELKTGIARERIIQEQENQNTQFVIPNTNNIVTESTLRFYRGKYHQYLTYRNITQETAEVYDIGYDEYNDHITFPIKDIYNKCIGLGRRAIKEKQYIYPFGMEKPLYGVYELPPFVRHLWVVEGPFNLWTLYQYKKSGVAMLGTGTQPQYKQLLDVICNDYVLALDGDKAGHDGIKKLGTFLQQNKKKVFVACVPDNQDINDMSVDQFRNMQVIEFNEWKKYF